MKLGKSFGRFLLRTYKHRKQRVCDTSTSHCLAVARETLCRTRYCFLISQGSSGWASARLVEPITDPDSFVLWIGTNPTLRKISEITSNPKVTLAFGNTSENANVVVYGTASIEGDAALRRKYWKGQWRLFFPNGPLSDDYVLIRVEALLIELMSFRRNVIPEPFGLRPVVLEKRKGQWHVQAFEP